MRKILYLALAFTLLISCKQNTSKTPASNFPISVGCYGYSDENSNITFQVTRVDPMVQGTLIYNYAEKDRNSGSFSGSIDQNIILGTYTFISEGIESTRQVAFKIDGDQLIEGFGEVTSSGKMMAFKNASDLNSNGDIPLTKNQCAN